MFLAWLLFRIARSWNQTGQKWAHLHDIRRTITVDYPNASAVLLVLGACTIAGIIASRDCRAGSGIITSLTLTLAVAYQMATDLGVFELADAVQVARLVYLLSVVYVLVEHDLHSFGLLIVVILVRAHNVSLVSEGWSSPFTKRSRWTL